MLVFCSIAVLLMSYEIHSVCFGWHANQKQPTGMHDTSLWATFEFASVRQQAISPSPARRIDATTAQNNQAASFYFKSLLGKQSNETIQDRKLNNVIFFYLQQKQLHLHIHNISITLETHEPVQQYCHCVHIQKSEAWQSRFKNSRHDSRCSLFRIAV